jgi:hypothetical protein
MPNGRPDKIDPFDDDDDTEEVEAVTKPAHRDGLVPEHEDGGADFPDFVLDPSEDGYPFLPVTGKDDQQAPIVFGYSDEDEAAAWEQRRDHGLLDGHQPVRNPDGGVSIIDVSETIWTGYKILSDAIDSAWESMVNHQPYDDRELKKNLEARLILLQELAKNKPPWLADRLVLSLRRRLTLVNYEIKKGQDKVEERWIQESGAIIELLEVCDSDYIRSLQEFDEGPTEVRPLPRPVDQPVTLGKRPPLSRLAVGLTAAGLTAAAAFAVYETMGWHQSKTGIDERVCELGSAEPDERVCELDAEMTSVPVYISVAQAFKGAAQADLKIAATTNALVHDFYVYDGGPRSWEKVKAANPWSDSPEALRRLEAHMRSWGPNDGGYRAVILSGEREDCQAKTIDELLHCVETDPNIGAVADAELVAQKLAEQVTAMKDRKIMPNQEKVAQMHKSMEANRGDMVKEINQNPPKPPVPFTYSANSSDQTEDPVESFGAYDAPDPVGVYLAQASEQEIPDVSDLLEEEGAQEEEIVDLSGNLEEDDPTEVVEPFYARPVAPEPTPVVAEWEEPTFSAEEEAFFQSAPQVVDSAPVATPVVEPTPSTWTQKLSSAVSSVKSSFSKWFGRA